MSAPSPARPAARPDFAIGGATLIATFALQLPFIRHQALLLDEGVVVQMALDIGQGKVPYRDAVHYAFPGVFYLTAAVFEVFGPTVEAARLLAAALFSVAAAACALMCRWWCTRRATAVFVLLLVAYRVWAFPHWHMLNYSPMAVAMSLVAAWLAGEQLGRRGLRWTLAAGVAAGCAILAKQDSGGAATAAIGLALLLLSDGDMRQRLRRAALFGASATVIVGAALAVVWWQGYLGDLLREGIYGPLYGVANYDYLRRPSLLPLFEQDAHLRANRFSYFPQIFMEAYGSELLASQLYAETSFYDVLTKLIYHLPWLTAAGGAVAGIAVLRKSSSPPAKRRLLVVLLALAFVAAFNPPHDWVHLLVLYPPTLLVLVSAVPLLRRSRVASIAATASVIFATAFSVHLALEFRARHSAAVHTERGTFYTRPVLAEGFREVLDAIKATPPDSPLVALPYHPFLNFLAARPPASRYLFLWPVEWNRDRDREIIASIESAEDPTLLYSPSQLMHLGSPRDFAPELFEYLVDHYDIGEYYGADEPGLGFLRLDRSKPATGTSLADAIATGGSVTKQEPGAAPIPLDPKKSLRFDLWPFRPVAALRTRPGAEVALRVPIVAKPGDRLVTAFATNPERWSDYFLPPIGYRLAIRDGQEETTLASAELITAKRPQERHWHEFDIDLSPWQGRAIELILGISTRPRTWPNFALGAWQTPRIVSGPSPAAQREAGREGAEP